MTSTAMRMTAGNVVLLNRADMPIKPENKARYPKNWKEIRQKVLERAGNCCEFCGIPNHYFRQDKGTRVVLTIAHLDHTPENCDMDNLRALCQKCHLNYDKEIHKAHASHTRAMKEKTLPIEFK